MENIPLPESGEYRNQLDRYDERHRFWQDKALSQLGIVTSVFFVISLGFTTYLIEKNDLHVVVTNLCYLKNWIFLTALIFSFLAILSGLACVLSRLYDLRLTRHEIWIRKKFYRRYKSKLSNEYIQLKGYNIFTGFVNLVSTVCVRYYYINDNDIKNKEKVRKKFTKLRERILYLGRFSWNALMSQVITITVGFILIVVYLMMPE